MGHVAVFNFESLLEHVKKPKSFFTVTAGDFNTIFKHEKFHFHVGKFLFNRQLNSTCLWITAWLPINKKQKKFFYQTSNLLNILFLFLVSTKEQKRDKGKYAIKFLRAWAIIFAMWKLSFTLQVIAHIFFSLDSWNTKP